MYDLSVVPPLCLDTKQKRVTFVNNNGFVADPVALFKAAKNEVYWNEKEKEIFLEKLLTYGKNFDVIASFLDKKKTQDCVEYFYATKKKVNYKLLIRKQQRKRKKDVKSNVNTNNNNNNSGGAAPTAGNSNNTYGNNVSISGNINNNSGQSSSGNNTAQTGNNNQLGLDALMQEKQQVVLGK
jgi:hypothetical protein